MPELKVLDKESKVKIQLSDTVDYYRDYEFDHSEDNDYRSRYGDVACLLTDYEEVDVIEFPSHLYEEGYNKIVTTIGKEGKVILYAFKRGKYARKFISDFNYLKLKTFVGYNEIPIRKYTGEEAYELMKQGESMSLDGYTYFIENGELYLYCSDRGQRRAKKKHLRRNDWILK